MAKKRPLQRQPQPSKRAQREAAAAKATFADDDESISSASEDDELQQPPVTDEREETVEEARLRRARAYVAEQRAAASDSDEDDLNERLREQREARSQRAFTRIDLDDFDGEACARRARGARLRSSVWRRRRMGGCWRPGAAAASSMPGPRGKAP